MKRLCTICARGGSKEIKDKNLRLLAGKPLIAHSLQQAVASGFFDAIAVSSDSDKILGVAEEWGANYLIKRPTELASDSSPKVPAIRHCLLAVEYRAKTRFNTIVDLDATAPLRNLDDIKGAVALLETESVGNVVSGTTSRRSPYFNIVELDEHKKLVLSKPLNHTVFRRQDSPQCYDLNASVYVWHRDALVGGSDSALGDDTRLFVMPRERSIDIDSELDFSFIEFIMKKAGR